VKKLILILSCIFFVIPCQARIIYVDANTPDNNDGSSWAKAYRYLQDALADANSNLDVNEIWVAMGTYKPDQGNGITAGDRNATFQLLNGVNLKGGYAGFGKPDPNARDAEAYETILDGHGKSYHVVTGSSVDSTAIIDGFIVTGGKYGWDGHQRSGAGMYNYHGSPTVRNCMFVRNSGYSGGGMGNSSSNATIRNCTFIGNTAELGGGMRNGYGSPNITNCTFISNSSRVTGGGMDNTQSRPVVNNCTFSWNSSRLGGGMRNYHASPTVVGCTFSWNLATSSGGGMENNGAGSKSIVTNCMFKGNSAKSSGGGIYNRFYSHPKVTNCSFYQNSAEKNGGGLNNRYASATVTNCTFSGNSANANGGGVNNRDSGANLVVTNCILWSNTASNGSQIYNTSSATVNYSDVQGSWPGTGNKNADPFFINASSGDLRLLPDSPCIDAGDNTAVPPDAIDLDGDGNTTEPIPWDIDGMTRFVDEPNVPDTGNGTAPIVDMGVFEADYIEVEMKLTPQSLKLFSRGRWVKAHFVLPECFAAGDVDTNTPAVIVPSGSESDRMNISINKDGFVEIMSAFDRSVFCWAVGNNMSAERTVTVIGRFTSGQYFYGTETIKIVNKTFEYLAVLTSHWLAADCDAPDWCEGGDVNQDSVVDFIDFALFKGCCIEVVKN